MTASLLSPPALPEGAAVKLIDGVHTTHGRLFRPFRSNSYPSSPLHFLIDTSQNLRVNGFANRGDWPPYYDYPSSQRDQFMMLVASLSVAPIPKDPSAAWLDHEAARLRHIKQRYSFTMLSPHCCLLRESFYRFLNTGRRNAVDTRLFTLTASMCQQEWYVVLFSGFSNELICPYFYRVYLSPVNRHRGCGVCSNNTQGV